MEKGGKAGKRSLKSTPKSLGGKNDNSAKPKRGRKVQLNPEEQCFFIHLKSFFFLILVSDRWITLSLQYPIVVCRRFVKFITIKLSISFRSFQMLLTSLVIGLTEGKFNFSSKSDGKGESLFNKGCLSKEGKTDKVANVAKASIIKESLPLELRIEQELQKNARCLMDCEAAHILEGIQEQMVLLSSDPTAKIPLSFDRGLQYAKTGSHYTNPQVVRGLLETLSKHGVTDGEICEIANVCPETVEEVFALVSSLKAKRSMLIDPLKDVLPELAKLKLSK